MPVSTRVLAASFALAAAFVAAPRWASAQTAFHPCDDLVLQPQTAVVAGAGTVDVRWCDDPRGVSSFRVALDGVVVQAVAPSNAVGAPTPGGLSLYVATMPVTDSYRH